MDVYTISAIINLVVAAFVGGIIWYKGQDRPVSNTFALFAFGIAVWSFGYILWRLSTTAQEALFWIRFFMAGAIYPPIFFFHFTLAFLKKQERFHQLFLYIGYSLMTFFFAANVTTSLFVTGTESILSFQYWPEPGSLFHPFLAIWLFYAGYAVFLLIRRYLNSTNEETKTQLAYILFGVAVAYIGGMTNYFLWYDIKVPPIGTVSASIYLGSIAYAIAKYQLFNTKVIITEFFSWLLMSVLIINVFLSTTTEQIIKNIVIVLLIGVSVYAFVKSVYREVKAREEAEQLTEDLKELNQEKSRMLSIASHQFRSPLTSIEGYASMIQDGSCGEVPDYLQEPVDRILKSSQKLAHIVDDFLNISRIEDGRIDYNVKPADVAEATKAVVEETRGSIDEEKQRLQFETDESGGYPAKVDVGKFQQVITNLVDNAIKYTEEGNITVRVKRKHSSITIEVEDEGIGIDPADTDKIFSQFARADEAQEVNVSGSGLGLYIARQIVEAHDGEIWATSPGDGEGSTFHVKIPAAGDTNK